MSLASAGGLAVSGALAILGWRAYQASRRHRETAASVLSKHKDALQGKRVLVTGACTGLGFALARAILQECKVQALLFHGRSYKRVDEAIASLPETLRADCKPVVADLGSLKDVDALAQMLKSSPPDVVVCCAGVATLPAWTGSADGYESQFAINHLAHFHLVSALLPSLDASARVVVVSSDLHHVGRKALMVDMTDLNSKKNYSWFGAYLSSKYCNVLFAHGLARRGLIAVSCSPGTVATNIDRYLSGPLRFCFRYLGPGLFAKSPEEGAATLAFCMVAHVTPGVFYADCKPQNLNGPELTEELWSASELLINEALKS